MDHDIAWNVKPHVGLPTISEWITSEGISPRYTALPAPFEGNGNAVLQY